MVSEDAAQSQSTLLGGVRRQAQPRRLGQQDGRFVSAIAHRKRACLEFGSCLPWNHFASSLLTILGIGPRLSTKWRQGWIGMGNVRPVGAPWRQPVPSLGKRWRDHKDPSFLSLPPAYGQSRAQATSSAPWSPMEIVVNIACDQSLKISLECLYGLTQFVHNNPVRNSVICDLQTVNQTDPDVASQKTPRLDPERPKLAEFHRSFGLSTWDMADSDCTVCSLAPVLPHLEPPLSRGRNVKWPAQWARVKRHTRSFTGSPSHPPRSLVGRSALRSVPWPALLCQGAPQNRAFGARPGSRADRGSGDLPAKVLRSLRDKRQGQAEKGEFGPIRRWWPFPGT